jgi:hypothetical protein
MNSSRKDILNQIREILSNQGKYFFWVPIAAFALGGFVAFAQHYFTKTKKYVIT